MEGVGAGLHGGVEEAAGHLAVFRREVTGLDRQFLNRVDAGLGLGLRVDQVVGGVLAFDAQRLRIARVAVDADAAIGAEVGTRQQQNRRIRVADTGSACATRADAHHRKVVHAVRVDVVADFAALGLQQRSCVGHRHRFRRCTYFHRYVDTHRRRNGNFNVLANESLESRRADGQFIDAGRNLRQGVVARVCGTTGGQRPGPRIASLNRGSRKNRAGRIGDGPRDGAAVALRKQRGSTSQ